ncbi:MAG: GDSL-type esterase/lipase family protein [Oscillospiraceae bacterium]|nr:GDSL-type esterase/lipase family protein [Oscillospiraceae bacterium]MDD4414501.1 GDSL-type esterase/lipase family protein [Oscillospiraceae bacterium]
MINRRLPGQRSIYIRHRRKNNIFRYSIITIIALVLLAVSVALAYWMDKPPTTDNAAAKSQSSSVMDTSSVTQTTLPPTTSTTTTATSTTHAATTTTKKLKPVGDEYFKDACLIGDSRTQGLMMYSAPDTATFYAFRSMTVASFFNKKEKINGQLITVENALKKKKFGKVYIMLGLNEMGWESSDAFIKRYGDVVNSVKKSQPKAKIYIQSVLPVTAAKSATKTAFNNPKVIKYNKLIYDMCVKKKLIYLNVREAVEDKKGNLPKDATTDGIHLNKTYCDKWMAYIRTHTDVPVATAPVITTTTKTATTTDASASQTEITSSSSSSSSATTTTSTTK